MNWKRLLAAIKAAGYTGDGDLDSVKAFVTENEVIDGGSGLRVTADTVTKMAGPRGKAIVIAFADSAIEGVERSGGEPSAEMDEPEDEKAMDEEDDGEKAVAPQSGKAKRPEPNVKGAATERKLAKAHANIAPGLGTANAQKKAYNAKAARGETVYPDADMAEAAGAWLTLAVLGGLEGTECRLPFKNLKNFRDIVAKSNVTTTFADGGALIPEDFEASLIELKEEYGAFTRCVGVEPMARDTKLVPRFGTDVTVYVPGEGTAITESSPTFDQVSLTARQWAALSTHSVEIANDTPLNLAEIITRSMKRAIEKKKDEVGFGGDGTSTYFGINGFRNAIVQPGTNPEDNDGLQLASGDTWSEIVLADVQKMMGLLPEYAETGNTRFVCSKRFWANVLQRLALAAGGTLAAEIIAGARQKTFLGYPVEIALAGMLNTDPGTGTTARDTVPLLFGDFGMAAKNGEVAGGIAIATSDQRYFEQALIGIRALYRTAVTVHDVGSDTEAGPVVGLIMEDA